MYPTTPMFRVSVTAWVGAGRVRVSYVLYLTANDDLTLLLAYLQTCTHFKIKQCEMETMNWRDKMGI